MARPNKGDEIKDKVYIGAWVPRSLKAAIAKMAKTSKRRPSDVMREALSTYVEAQK